MQRADYVFAFASIMFAMVIIAGILNLPLRQSSVPAFTFSDW